MQSPSLMKTSECVSNTNFASMAQPSSAGDSSKPKRPAELRKFRLQHAYVASSLPLDTANRRVIGQNFLEDFDVVVSQGSYLITRPPTPIWNRENVDEFAAALCRRLRSIESVEEWPWGNMARPPTTGQRPDPNPAGREA